MIAAAAAEIHSVLRAGDIVATEFVRNVGVAVAHALPMRRIVRPVIAVTTVDIVDVDIAVDIDVVAAPIEAAAPVAASGPAAECIASAEGDPGRDNATGNVARRRPVIRRIGRIRPCAINDGWIVIRDVDRVGLSRRDNDDLLATLLLCRHLLLFV